MSKISHKMYSALTRGGVSPEVARRVAESVDFLRESTEQSDERDNYDILMTAKAISSLVNRHKDISPIMPQMPDEISSDMTRVNAAVGANPDSAESNSGADKPFITKNQKRESSFIKSIRRKSPGIQNFLAHFMPCIWYLLMVLLTVACIALIVLSIASMIVITVGGIVLFFSGLLYGVSQFSVFRGAAFFEIGLALGAGGLAVLFSVLIFNFLTRTVPFCLKRGTSALRKLCGELADLRRKLNRKIDA